VEKRRKKAASRRKLRGAEEAATFSGGSESAEMMQMMAPSSTTETAAIRNRGTDAAVANELKGTVHRGEKLVQSDNVLIKYKLIICVFFFYPTLKF